MEWWCPKKTQFEVGDPVEMYCGLRTEGQIINIIRILKYIFDKDILNYAQIVGTEPNSWYWGLL